MPEIIHKLQPDRTIHLRGFDHLGASAAVHQASPNGFRVTGRFRDAADFAVLMLYDADDFFGHPTLKPLPDFDFSGLTLSFDVSYTNLMPLNCRKYASIDWPYLDVVTPAGATSRIRLSDHATVVAGQDSPAQAAFTIDGASLDAWDRLTLWYQNLAFDYIVPGKVRTTYPFYVSTLGEIHSITVRDRAYSHVTVDGDTSASVAAHLRDQINGLVAGIPADPEVSASPGAEAWEVLLETKLDTAATVTVNASGQFAETLHHIKSSTVCRALRDQINGANYAAAATPFALSAVASGDTLQLSTVQGGYDADFITLYSTSKNLRLRTTQPEAAFAGGASGATLRVTLDFAALGLPQIRQMWLTFAPRLPKGPEYLSEEWQAVFSNWSVTGPDAVKYRKVAGPASVLVPSTDGRCRYTGFWVPEEGFFYGNLAQACRMPGSTVTVRYCCEQPHDLWIGTSLYAGRGAVNVEVDGVLYQPLDAALAAEPAVVSRRKVASGLPPGEHTARLTALSAEPFYFDYLQAVVPGGIPAPLPAQTFQTPALDYSTDHTYKLPPARILWMLDQLGCAGPINEYIGVFWWNQRTRVNGLLPELTLEFSGPFQGGDQAFVTIGGQTCGKTLFPGEDAAVVARHFALLINATYVGVRALAAGGRLTIRALSAHPAYSYPVSAAVQSLAGTVAGGGALSGGSMGDWEVDPAAPQTLNAGARAWHDDFYRLCAASGRQVTTAVSMELVNPPAPFAARFPDGAPVLTSTGFGGLHSTHCAFRADVLAYQVNVFKEIAGMMAAAGLTPDLQCGEFSWWYFTNWSQANPAGGMAFYDSDTTAAAQTALGRPLLIFRTPGDDPMANAGADASFLANRLKTHVDSIISTVRSTYPGARFELLFPYDVNHPVPAGIHQLGGRLNRKINFPTAWESKVSAGFDRLKIESLDFGAWSRDLDLARESLAFPLTAGWPANSVRAMIPVFRGGYPWSREVEYAMDLGMEGVNLWAFDHICLYGWWTGPPELGRGVRQG
ncbi:MAG: hypothetical protein HY858_14505 [Candidatus Solibacter usitatus]|nr:hypothetical protein [Candidatus Solibacter usitatus]